jgi:ADP-ribosyl-[dinitrogen reductase] hydrolase
LSDDQILDADQYVDPAAPTVKDRFLGAMLGMGIADALAMPTRGLSRDQIRELYGEITTYHPLLTDDGDLRVPAGQFTDNTELALCLSESLVSSNGFLDPSLAGYRFVQLLSSEYSHFLGQTTRKGLESAVDTGEYQSGPGEDGTAGASPATRVAPIALVHSLSTFNSELLVREVMRSSFITHTHPESVNGALAVAYGTRLMTRRELPPEMLIEEVLAFIDEDAVAHKLRQAKRLLDAGTDETEALEEIGTSGYVAETVAAAFYLFERYGGAFEPVVFAAANAGGATSSIGSIAGMLAGVWTGAERINPDLIEGLDGRMYILMAAPTLLRVAQLRAGLYLQLHQR